MKNLVCLRHPEYNGKNAPNLSCRNCCSIYVEAVKDEIKSSKTIEAAQDVVHKHIEPKTVENWLQKKALDANANIKR
jgi:hypothetical protein